MCRLPVKHRMYCFNGIFHSAKKIKTLTPGKVAINKYFGWVEVATHIHAVLIITPPAPPLIYAHGTARRHTSTCESHP